MQVDYSAKRIQSQSLIFIFLRKKEKRVDKSGNFQYDLIE